MCLSTVIRENDQTVLMKNTSRIDRDGEDLLLHDLFGATMRIKGVISTMDFEANTVTIREGE